MVTSRAYPLFGGRRGYLEVVGESFHRKAIAKLLPSSATDWQRIETTFELVPEPDNPHDRWAASVRVDGNVFGYLPKEVARSWAPVLRRVLASGLVPTIDGGVSGSSPR